MSSTKKNRFTAVHFSLLFLLTLSLALGVAYRSIDEASRLRVEVKDQEDAARKLRHERDDAIEKLETKLASLQDADAEKQDVIDKHLNGGFGKPDGRVVSVDNRTNTVWIDLGTADGLPERMTFSIGRDRHSQLMDLMERKQQKAGNVQNDGVENVRAQTDVKGVIEITRIQANRAEARILKNDVFASIRPGDLIYTPRWIPAERTSGIYTKRGRLKRKSAAATGRTSKIFHDH